MLLAGQHDPNFNKIVLSVATGEIKEINFHKMDRPNESGNPLLPVHSMPVKPDDSKYISELNR